MLALQRKRETLPSAACCSATTRPAHLVRPGVQLGMRPTARASRLRTRAAPEHGAAVTPSSRGSGLGRRDHERPVRGFLLAVPELVKTARELTWTVGGKTGKVGEQMNAGAVETLLRDEAKTAGASACSSTVR